MSRWEAYARKVVPYVPGEQPDLAQMIKLNTNENPYPPSPLAAAALAGLETDSLRLYPDPSASELVSAIAGRYGVREEEVFAGVGSDDVIAMAFQTFFCSDRPILFPDITYSFYRVWAEAFRIPYRTLALDENFEIDPGDYRGEIGGIIFPNPNAPTGLALPLDRVEEIVRNNKNCVVIVDEAYVDFGAESAVGLLADCDNLLVIQTFSKSRSLAGMRVGFALGNERLIRYLQAYKHSFNSYTLNRPAIAAGAAAIGDEAYFQECRDRIIRTREQTKRDLKELGFRFFDSSANFIFAEHERMRAEDIFRELRERRIFVRYFRQERIDNYLRITIGREEEMAALKSALTEILR